MKTFTQSQLQAIADALGDTDCGLTGSEIGHLLATVKIADTDPQITKRHRLYNAFASDQNNRQQRTHIIAFIRRAMKPERFAREPERFEPMRLNLNRALAFAGLAVRASGQLEAVGAAETLSQATRRAMELRADLTSRGIHPDVMHFCREELLADNYFHAVLEAVKSVADKIRQRTGLTDDGAILVDRAFGGEAPMLVINALRSENEKSEQRGFSNLVKGTFSMFRNTTAHAPKIHWQMSTEDAEDLFSMVSLMHRPHRRGGHATKGLKREPVVLTETRFFALLPFNTDFCENFGVIIERMSHGQPGCSGTRCKRPRNLHRSPPLQRAIAS
ncbi:TIGR02391 family protein [Rhizobium sp. BT-175]|uniref:TIGR02391 family protein n=1 Tax=Rhizobium sp. BT-175 TaxID=2986929 RepID=UPI0022358F22|nr:TIGR02391 family protein [Rhizobium sp. BT-175]MCV9947462.1 TIGR02391 family protein [Rhizobium sp. BT-175]